MQSKIPYFRTGAKHTAKREAPGPSESYKNIKKPRALPKEETPSK